MRTDSFKFFETALIRRLTADQRLWKGLLIAGSRGLVVGEPIHFRSADSGKRWRTGGSVTSTSSPAVLVRASAAHPSCSTPPPPAPLAWSLFLLGGMPRMVDRVPVL